MARIRLAYPWRKQRSQRACRWRVGRVVMAVDIVIECVCDRGAMACGIGGATHPTELEAAAAFDLQQPLPLKHKQHVHMRMLRSILTNKIQPAYTSGRVGTAGRMSHLVARIAFLFNRIATPCTCFDCYIAATYIGQRFLLVAVKAKGK